MAEARGGRTPADAAERHRRLKRIVLEADGLEGAACEGFLADACAGDDDLLRAAREVLGRGGVPTGDVSPAGAPGAPDERPPARLGPFRVLREIGRGGMGVVYEAQDERDGGRVAVKAVHAHLLGNARAEERFAREAAAGAQVRHANVVRTLGALRVEDDAGRGRGVLVTELVEGRTLRDLVRSLGRVPESLVREIGRGIAHGVAAIHAAGIVHRDLKPENVMLTTDARVRVMDLGVARVLDDGPGPTREGDFVGSLEYASPEQCVGATAGAPADLYAIGVVLHELVSGANPFARNNAIATVAAHLTAVPPPLESSGFLAAVVAKLLAKEPAARFASAAELARVLEEAEDGAWWRLRAPQEPAQGAAPHVPVTRDLPLRGRERELRALGDAWASARDGRGATVLLTGEPGVGKSRVLDEFLRANGATEFRMGYGAIPPTGGPSGLTDALLAVLGGDDAARWLVERAVMPESLATALVSWLRREPPPGGTPSLAADAVQLAIRRALRVRAQERPIAIAVDDVHNAGAETGALIVSLARELAGDRVLIVLTSRPLPRPRWIADLAALPGFRESVLTRLSSGDIAEILRAMLPSEDLALRAAQRIAAKSGGVPLYVATIVGSLREALAASPAARRARVIDEIQAPMALREAVAARLAGLPTEERTLLEVCAVQGAWFDAETSAAVLSAPLVRVLQSLAELERRVGLVRAEGRRFRFDCQALAEETADMLPAALAEEYHLRIADAMAARAKPRAPLEILAVHYAQSSRPDLALPHLLPALDALTARHENDAALRLAARALAREGLLAGPSRAEVLLRVAALRHLACDRAEQAAAAEEALALARETRDPALLGKALGAVGTHLASTGAHRRSLPPLRAAIRLARRTGDRQLEVWASATLSTPLIRLGRVAEARSRLDSAVRLADEEKDAGSELTARRAVGLLALGVGRYDDARAAFERCLALSRTLATPRGEAMAEWGLGIADVHAGDWESARARFVRVRDGGRAIGERVLEVNALGNLAMCHDAEGAWHEAEATLAEMRQIVEETGDRGTLAVLLHNLAQARYCLGDREGFRAAADEAAALAGSVGFRRAQAQVALCRAEAAQERGDFAAARELLLEAEAHLAAAGDPAGRIDTLLCLGKVARETGELAEAVRLVDEARAVAATLARPASRMLAEAARAALPGGDAAAARAIVEQVGGRAMLSLRMHAHLDLYRGSHEKRDLAAAAALLSRALGRMPAERRRAAVENVLLHREIAIACRREGLPPPL
jgi:tetratricopeptide (TPR) repeat protein